ncbi:MAG TPA: iron-containing alcohol dehydrogenase, partial [Candidatus Dormibacteraeota bacterium]|nr:iron-containing alcohol dehydrogenase [Candidatus Dormibacteraeota bacterium]
MSGVFTYSNPRVIHWGSGSVSALALELARLDAHNLVLVTTRSLVAEERLISVLQRSLGDVRVAVTIVVSQHAPMTEVDAGIQKAGDAQVDGVVSFGGGSSIDAAKMLAVTLADRAGQAYRGLPHIAVP